MLGYSRTVSREYDIRPTSRTSSDSTVANTGRRMQSGEDHRSVRPRHAARGQLHRRAVAQFELAGGHHHPPACTPLDHLHHRVAPRAGAHLDALRLPSATGDTRTGCCLAPAPARPRAPPRRRRARRGSGARVRTRPGAGAARGWQARAQPERAPCASTSGSIAPTVAAKRSPASTSLAISTVCPGARGRGRARQAEIHLQRGDVLEVDHGLAVLTKSPGLTLRMPTTPANGARICMRASRPARAPPGARHELRARVVQGCCGSRSCARRGPGCGGSDSAKGQAGARLLQLGALHRGVELDQHSPRRTASPSRKRIASIRPDTGRSTTDSFDTSEPTAPTSSASARTPTVCVSTTTGPPCEPPACACGPSCLRHCLAPSHPQSRRRRHRFARLPPRACACAPPAARLTDGLGIPGIGAQRGETDEAEREDRRRLEGIGKRGVGREEWRAWLGASRQFRDKGALSGSAPRAVALRRAASAQPACAGLNRPPAAISGSTPPPTDARRDPRNSPHGHPRRCRVADAECAPATAASAITSATARAGRRCGSAGSRSCPTAVPRRRPRPRDCAREERQPDPGLQREEGDRRMLRRTPHDALRQLRQAVAIEGDGALEIVHRERDHAEARLHVHIAAQRHRNWPDCACTTHCSGPHWQFAGPRAAPPRGAGRANRRIPPASPGPPAPAIAPAGAGTAARRSTATAAAESPESVTNRARIFIFDLLGRTSRQRSEQAPAARAMLWRCSIEGTYLPNVRTPRPCVPLSPHGSSPSASMASWRPSSPRQWRDRTFEGRCAADSSLKHVIEALGVPHTEVGRVLVDGRPAPLERRLCPGEQVRSIPMPRCGSPARPRRRASSSTPISAAWRDPAPGRFLTRSTTITSRTPRSSPPPCASGASLTATANCSSAGTSPRAASCMRSSRRARRSRSSAASDSPDTPARSRAASNATRHCTKSRQRRWCSACRPRCARHTHFSACAGCGRCIGKARTGSACARASTPCSRRHARGAQDEAAD